MTLLKKITKGKRAGGMVQVVQVSNKCKALRSTSCTAKKYKRKKKRWKLNSTMVFSGRAFER
jgi:hypothetical protein